MLNNNNYIKNFWGSELTFYIDLVLAVGCVCVALAGELQKWRRWPPAVIFVMTFCGFDLFEA